MNLENRLNRRQFLRLAGITAGGLGLATAGAAFSPNIPILQADDSEPQAPAPRVAAPTAVDVTVLMYHETRAAKLTSDLRGLISAGYQPISPETFVRAFSGEVVLPVGQRLFFLTLDDGLLSQYQAVLKTSETVQQETGWFVPATFFVNTKFNDPDSPIDQISGDTRCYRDGVHSYMTRDQLVDLIQQGHWVDNHTVDHANLPQKTTDVRNSEVEVGRDRINSLWKLAGKNKLYDLFAYPFGAYLGQTAYLDSLGYNLAFSERKTTHHLASERLYIGRIGM